MFVASMSADANMLVLTATKKDAPLPLGPMIAAMLDGWNSALTSCSRRSFSLRLARLRTCAQCVYAMPRVRGVQGNTACALIACI